MTSSRTLSLYARLYKFFIAKENKKQTLSKYLQKTIIRGGTFWGWFLFVLFLNIDYFVHTGDYYALTIFINQLYFIPIGFTYGVLRELYFDYESTR